MPKLSELAHIKVKEMKGYERYLKEGGRKIRTDQMLEKKYHVKKLVLEGGGK
jgi:hypothetical protein